MKLLVLLIAGAAFLGACFAVVVAFGAAGLCENDCGGSLAALQVWVPLLGLGPAGVMLARSIAGRYRAAAAWGAVAVVMYGAWAVINEAVVRGTQHMERSTPFACLAAAIALGLVVVSVRASD